MIASVSLQQHKNWLLIVGGCMTVAIGFMIAFPLSYLTNTNVLIGVCLLPFAFIIQGRQRNNLSLLIASILFAVAAWKFNVNVFYFFHAAFFLLWLAELAAGRCNPVIVFLVFWMSPIVTQVVTILGFPLRLMLSEVAGAILTSVGFNVIVEGNLVNLNGQDFAVDEACMGLNMLVMAMLAAVFTISQAMRNSARSVSSLVLIAFFAAAFIFNLFTNLARIISLIVLEVPAEDPMHEFIGLLCFTLYSLLPLYLLSGPLVKKYGSPIEKGGISRPTTTKQLTSALVLTSVVITTGIVLSSNSSNRASAQATVTYEKLHAEKIKDDVSKIATDDLLIYVKPIAEFFTGEHTPLICWKGSGYTISGIREVSIADQVLYFGTLEKEGSKLFTAWWFTNGEITTISQADWRFRMLIGQPKFSLINVTSHDEQLLREKVKSIFQNGSLSIQYL